MEKTGYYPREWRLLSRDGREWGLIVRTTRTKGSMQAHEYRLTPGGVEMADLALRIEALGKELRAKAPPIEKDDL